MTIIPFGGTFAKQQKPKQNPSFAKEPPSKRTKTTLNGQTNIRQKRSTNR